MLRRDKQGLQRHEACAKQSNPVARRKYSAEEIAKGSEDPDQSDSEGELTSKRKNKNKSKSKSKKKSQPAAALNTKTKQKWRQYIADTIQEPEDGWLEFAIAAAPGFFPDTDKTISDIAWITNDDG